MAIRRTMWAVGIACLTALISLAPTPSQAAAGDSNAATPVIYVHGYDAFGTGVSCTTWSNMTGFLTSHGFTGPQVTVKYYHNDSGCGANLNNFGTQSAYFSGGLINGEDSPNTDIKHIGYQLAWYVYTTYTSKGQAVGLVGHSMGGLIIRYALYRIAAADPNFPPSMLVTNAVTFGTPHNGASLASICFNIECAEMAPNSSFLKDLNTSGQNPQGTGGTDWTIMGSDADTIVSDSSATSMTAAHKVRYASGDHIGHLDYFNETQTTLNAALSYSDNGSPFVSTTTGQWCVLRAQLALSGAGY